MDLSIIVVNWNTKKLLENCLSSIYKYTRSFVESDSTKDDGGEEGIKFEVIVVDNGSKDGSQAMVKTKFPQVKLIPNKDNLGFTKANNQGIKIAKGKYVLLLNSDTYLIENSLTKLVQKAKSIKNLGAIGPLLLTQDTKIQQSAGFFPHLLQVFWWMSFIDDLPGGTILKPYHVDHDSFYRQDRQVDWVTAAAILVPKSVITRVGSLDEAIFMYGEEVEWCYRIKNAGFSVYFTPVTNIIHIGRGSQIVPAKSFIGEYQGVIYFYQKHKSKISLQIVRYLLKMGALLRIAVFRILARKELSRAYVEAFKMV